MKVKFDSYQALKDCLKLLDASINRSMKIEVYREDVMIYTESATNINDFKEELWPTIPTGTKYHIILTLSEVTKPPKNVSLVPFFNSGKYGALKLSDLSKDAPENEYLIVDIDSKCVIGQTTDLKSSKIHKVTEKNLEIIKSLGMPYTGVPSEPKHLSEYTKDGNIPTLDQIRKWFIDNKYEEKSKLVDVLFEAVQFREPKDLEKLLYDFLINSMADFNLLQRASADTIIIEQIEKAKESV